MEEMLAETMRQTVEKGLVKSRAIIVDSTYSSSKGNPETPAQILRRITKKLLARVNELLEGDKIKSIQPAEDEDASTCHKSIDSIISRLNTVVSNGNSRDDGFYNKDAGTLQCPEGHLAMR